MIVSSKDQDTIYHVDAADFIAEWDAVVRREREKAFASGVPNAADDLHLVRAAPAILNTDSIPADAARFLYEAGLPRSCAPFLSFDAVSKGPLRLIEYYGSHQFHPNDSVRLGSYYVLGSDGAGNPLCLDSSRNGEVVMLDHEDHFQTRTFVSSTVATLAEAWLILHTLARQNFINHLRLCDPPAAQPTAFLPAEVATLSS
jgi:hypothetical protein